MGPQVLINGIWYKMKRHFTLVSGNACPFVSTVGYWACLNWRSARSGIWAMIFGGANLPKLYSKARHCRHARDVPPILD
jgi:hypothetical protein